MKTLSLGTIKKFIENIPIEYICKATGISRPVISCLKKGTYQFNVKRETQQVISDFCVEFANQKMTLIKADKGE